MISKLKVIMGLAVLALALEACDGLHAVEGNGERVVETRELDDFTSIRAKGSYAVHLVKGSQPGITIETDANLLEYVDIYVDGDRLVLDQTERIRSKKGNKLTITYTELESLSLSGAVAIDNEGVLASEYLRLDVSGAGAVELAIDTREFIVDMSGASALELSGAADELDISLSGAGGIDAADLECYTCSIEVSGVGGATVNCSEHLRAQVSGVGGVGYYGNPTVDKKVSGLGSVHREGDGHEGREHTDAAIDEINEGIDDAMDEVSAAVSASMDEVSQELDKAMEEMHNGLEEAREEIQAAAEEATEALIDHR